MTLPTAEVFDYGDVAGEEGLVGCSALPRAGGTIALDDSLVGCLWAMPIRIQ